MATRERVGDIEPPIADALVAGKNGAPEPVVSEVKA